MLPDDCRAKANYKYSRNIGGLAQRSKQGALPLEQAAQDAGDGKGPVAVGYGSKNLVDKLGTLQTSDRSSGSLKDWDSCPNGLG